MAAFLTGLLMPLIFCSMIQLSYAATTETDLERLNLLVSENLFTQAYALSLELLDEYEGDPEFDFLYGLAALETGHPNEAVFAFERIAILFPRQQRVKLELARAFYQSNNLAVAKQLFNEVLAEQPPANVQANIREFLNSIDSRESMLESSINWYVNTGYGRDTNINSATELGIINTPIGDVELSPNGLSIEDNFSDLGGGFSYIKPLSKTSSVTLNGSYLKHNNLDSSDFDLDVLTANVNYAHVINNIRLAYGGRAQKVRLDSTAFQDNASLTANLQRSPGNGWTQSLTAAYTAIRYDDGINANADLRDVNQLLFSGVLGKSVGNFFHSISMYYGDETERSNPGRNNAQEFYGVALAEQVQLFPGHMPYLRISIHKSDYKSEAPVFNIRRKDETFSGSLGWIWTVTSRINITTDVTYIDNKSNIDLFAYDRVKYQAGLRYQF